MRRSKPDPAPEVERVYLDELAERLSELLGETLVGVYAAGSYALGDYQRPDSDIDVAVVVEKSLPQELRSRIVASLRHESLPCPARGLELVVYRLRTARANTASRDFELNLNSGSEMALKVEAGPGSGPTHWFPIDRSILAEAGIAILGPPADQVFAEIAPAQLRSVLDEADEWHRANAGDSEDARLNRVRAQRFLEQGRWISKREASRGLGDQTLTRPLNSVSTSLGNPGTSSRSSTDE